MLGKKDNREVIKLVRHMPEGLPLRHSELRAAVKVAYSECYIKLIGMAEDHYQQAGAHRKGPHKGPLFVIQETHTRPLFKRMVTNKGKPMTARCVVG